MKSLDPLAGVSTFLQVAKLQSFSAAADRLRLGRATVSAQVAELEQRLGVRLLQRTTRLVTLTEAGRAYAEALQDVPARAAEAERIAVAFQTRAIGRLRVSAPVEIGHRHLIPLLPEFLRERRDLRIDLDLSSVPVDVIKDGFDLAIRGTIAVEPQLIVRKLGASPVLLAATPGYLRRHGRPARPEDLAKHDCLHFSSLRWGRSWLLTRDGVEQRAPIHPLLEVNDGEALRRAALAGLGITMLPAFLIGPDIRAGRLRRVLDEWSVPSVALNAVYPANRHIAAKVRAFAGFLAAHFATIEDLGGVPRSRLA